MNSRMSLGLLGGDFPSKTISVADLLVSEMATSLSLCSKALSRVPDSVSNLSRLRSLNLGDNKLQELPSWIEALTNLQQLSLRNNQFSNLPECISRLVSLTSLHIYNNKITQLPSWIVTLTNLKALYLMMGDGAGITHVPHGIQYAPFWSQNIRPEKLSWDHVDVPEELVKLRWKMPLAKVADFLEGKNASVQIIQTKIGPKMLLSFRKAMIKTGKAYAIALSKVKSAAIRKLEGVICEHAVFRIILPSSDTTLEASVLQNPPLTTQSVMDVCKQIVEGLVSWMQSNEDIQLHAATLQPNHILMNDHQPTILPITHELADIFGVQQRWMPPEAVLNSSPWASEMAIGESRCVFTLGMLAIFLRTQTPPEKDDLQQSYLRTLYGVGLRCELSTLITQDTYLDALIRSCWTQPASIRPSLAKLLTYLQGRLPNPNIIQPKYERFAQMSRADFVRFIGDIMRNERIADSLVISDLTHEKIKSMTIHQIANLLECDEGDASVLHLSVLNHMKMGN
eukprot:TRINITY_DN363_c0_g1_i2.p1 TRINITY_DN363_c0_g1~~TRINITY_DN363_c0_g1_i2.p1  ORF type:complete len:511 (+),score=102.42 TRINITY_DN363_c0_g1_i2:401-1933(+)